MHKKLSINLYDVIAEVEDETGFIIADSDNVGFELPDFSHGYKNHIPIWQD